MERKTHKVFDGVFHRILQTASHGAVVNLINGLFDTKYPPNSTVSFPNPVTITEKLKEIVSDIMILVNGTELFHVEAQIDDDLNMALRMFKYDFEEGLKRAETSKRGELTIKFPKARVLYWETTKNTPDTLRVNLVFPDNTTHKYEVGTFKVLNHDVAELAGRKLLLLLPFYVLKLRKQVFSAKTHENRLKLSAEMKVTLSQLSDTLDQSEKTGLLTKVDKEIILDHIDVLFTEVYSSVKEFKEAEMIKIVTRVEKERAKERRATNLNVAQKLLENGVSIDIITKSTGVSVNKIEKLRKTA
jgi:hypothetical protein